MTDTGSKSFDCALVSALEPYEGPLAGGYLHYLHYLHYLFALQWGLLLLDYLLLAKLDYLDYLLADWLATAESRMLYEPDAKATWESQTRTYESACTAPTLPRPVPSP